MSDKPVDTSAEAKPTETPAAAVEEKAPVEIPAAKAKPAEAATAAAETPAAETKTVQEASAAVAEETPAEEAVTETTPAAAPVAEAAPVVQEAKEEAKPEEAAPAEKAVDTAAPAEAPAAETAAAATETAPVAETAPAVETTPAEATPAAVETPAETPAPVPEVTPLQTLWAAAKENGHPEIWGVTLADPDTDVPSQIVLQKYLNANDGDLAKAKDQLLKTLTWRAQMKPLELLKKAYNSNKFSGLGYVTVYTAETGYDPADPDTKVVFTWNIYGNVKNMPETFGNLEEFIEWRVALMELALQELSLATATKPITATEDPYKIYQVHDYKSISFLRQSPQVKSASTATISVFAQNYPELLKEKFFVNVPAIMGFVYNFIKLFVAAKTIKKFHPMSNGSQLANEFAKAKVSGLGKLLPSEYGGSAGELKAVGTEPLLAAPVAPVEEKTAEAMPEAPAETKADEA